jgi:16S rRNA (uracil1498-N3)-methyltransferase
VLRLFVPSGQAAAGHVRIAGTELRHLRTLRLGPGDAFVVFDEEGAEHEVRLERLTGREATAAIVATARPIRESAFSLVLAPALLKGSKLDLVVEKATELGVARIAPVRSRHTLGAAHLERWRRIALAAAKQSGRTRIPAVDAPVTLAELVRQPWSGARVILWEDERDGRLASTPESAVAAVVLVGPEGGFTADEVADARDHGFLPVRVAPRILRAETASLAACALCLARWGDVG